VARKSRTVLLTLIGPPLCGVLLASLVIAAWVGMGLPSLAQGKTWFRITKVPPTGQTSFTSGQPDGVQFFLVVGNDSRDPNGIGLGDAIHVIGVNPGARGATIIDIPRDTSPGGGKINSILANQGLSAFTGAISNFVGVPIKFAMTTNFAGFVDMVNELGGIDINITQPMHDQNSGTHFDPGPRHLNGEGALAFSRDRYSFSAGDISRTENQGYLMITALQNFQARNTGPGGVLNALGVLGRHVRMENTSLPELYRLARLVLTIDPAAIRNVVIPTGGGSGSNLSPGPGIDALFADFRDDALLQSH
jgi:polyisoprenyl-teichoic acid--peptidoglycan teichoic acid transferase